MSFFEELKRRKVFRVAATYAVVAWILMQIGEVTFPALNIPEWVMSTLVVVLLAGFPIAMIFAWIFDKTPQGYIKTDASDSEKIGGMDVKIDAHPFYMQKKNIFLAFGVLFGILIGIYGGDTFKESIDDKSIAVLPFDNYSTAKEDQYFSDGITEVITANLAKIGGLKVISRTSVMEYKNTTKKVKEIAKELGVAHILEGSIQRIGDNIRIVGQLINTDSDEHIWAETYDGKIDDIFLMQTDVALKISEALKVEISDKAVTLINNVPTKSIEAYDLYLKGLAQYNYYLIDSTKKSIETYKRALKIDPDYALAHAGICNSYGWMEIHTGISDYLTLGENACREAISIEDKLAEAWKGLGNLEFRRGNYSNALEYQKKAVSINPNYESAKNNIVLINYNMGNLATAYTGILEILQKDGKVSNLMANWLIGFNLALGSWENAEKIILNELKKRPASPQLRSTLATLYFNAGKEQKHSSQVEILNLESPNGQVAFRHNLIREFYKANYQDAIKWHARIENPLELDLIKLFSLKTIGINKDYIQLRNQLYEQYNNLYIDEIIDNMTLVGYAILLSIDGNQEKSMALLNEAVEKGFRNLAILENWPHASELKEIEGYQLIKNKLNKLINVERSKLQWPPI
tara:strand:+ start:1721 stop:3622 length:1902 start_codon:yes stop_codon:yes gene_type:complete